MCFQGIYSHTDTLLIWPVTISLQYTDNAIQSYWINCHLFFLITLWLSEFEHHINLSSSLTAKSSIIQTLSSTLANRAAGGRPQPWNVEEVQVLSRFWEAQKEMWVISLGSVAKLPAVNLDHFPSISRMLRVRALSGLQSALWRRGSSAV